MEKGYDLNFDPLGKGVFYRVRCGDLTGCFAAFDFLIPCKACKFEVTKGSSKQSRLLSLKSNINYNIPFRLFLLELLALP